MFSNVIFETQEAHKTDYGEFINDYSENFALNALSGGYGNNRPYSEEFAECIRLFFTNREFLRVICPAKENYLSDLFDM